MRSINDDNGEEDDDDDAPHCWWRWGRTSYKFDPYSPGLSIKSSSRGRRRRLGGNSLSKSPKFTCHPVSVPRPSCCCCYHRSQGHNKYSIKSSLSTNERPRFSRHHHTFPRLVHFNATLVTRDEEKLRTKWFAKSLLNPFHNSII